MKDFLSPFAWLSWFCYSDGNAFSTTSATTSSSSSTSIGSGAFILSSISLLQQQQQQQQHQQHQQQRRRIIISSSSSSTSSDANNQLFSSQAPLTELDVLARNQGELSMPTQEERNAALTKQRLRLETKGKEAEEGRESTNNDENINNNNNNNNVHLEYNIDVDKEGFGASLMENGVVRMNNVLSSQTANEMIHYVDKLLLDTTFAVEEGIFPREALFGTVYGKQNRWDLLLPIEEVVVSQQQKQQKQPHLMKKALSECLHPGSPIAQTIESILGKDAELYELSTLISDPGSLPQPLHPDIQYQDTLHPLLTCFIALQDVERNMGPTLFMKSSATQEFHDDLHNRHLDVNATGLIATSYNELGTLNQGDCSLYSAMTLHCGSANKSKNQRRRLFYFSFMNKALFRGEEGGDGGDGGGGRKYVSIRPEIEQRHLSLRNIQGMIEEWNEEC